MDLDIRAADGLYKKDNTNMDNKNCQRSRMVHPFFCKFYIFILKKKFLSYNFFFQIFCLLIVNTYQQNCCMHPFLGQGAFIGLGVAVKDVIAQLSKAFTRDTLFVCQNLCKNKFKKTCIYFSTFFHISRCNQLILTFLL